MPISAVYDCLDSKVARTKSVSSSAPPSPSNVSVAPSTAPAGDESDARAAADPEDPAAVV